LKPLAWKKTGQTQKRQFIWWKNIIIMYFSI